MSLTSEKEQKPVTAEAIKAQGRREVNRLFCAVLLFNLAFAAVVTLRPFPEMFIKHLSLALSIIGPICVVPFAWCGSRAWRKFVQATPSGEMSKKPLLSPILLGLGALAYPLGEACWWYIEFIQHKEVPAASFADPVFLSAYPLYMLAVLIMPLKSSLASGRARVLMDGFIALAALFAFNWYYRIGPALLDNQAGWVERLVTTAYPVNDMVLLAALVMLWLQFRDSVSRPIVRLGLLGFAALVVGDLIYAFQMQNDLYKEGHLLDVSWTLAHMTIVVMALAVRWSVLIAQTQQEKSSGQSRMASALRTFLPYAFVPAVIVLLISVSTKAGDPRLKMGVYVSAVILLSILLLRQIVALLENQRLYQQVQVDKIQIEKYAVEQEAHNEELTAMQEELEAQNLQLVSAQYELEAQNELLEEANERLESLATTDGMTGLYNHRAFQERLYAENARAERGHLPLAMLLLDVDKFKDYNDSFGHPAGDEALREVARILKFNVREMDFSSRYGGEEFAILLPDTDREGAEQVAERIRAAIEAAKFPHRAVTVSIGVGIRQIVDTPAELIARTDTALYAAKHGGRNRVVSEVTP